MKLKANYSTAALVLCLIGILPACKRVEYRTEPLKPIDTSASYTQRKQGVTLAVKKLNKKETKELFNGRGKVLLDRNIPIIPVQIAITNNTSTPISITGIESSLPHINQTKIYNKIRFGYTKTISTSCLGTLGLSALVTGGLILGTAGLGFFIAAPVGLADSLVAFLASYSLATMGIVSTTAVVVSTPFVAGAVTYGQTQPIIQANKQLHADIIQKTDISQEAIQPKEQKNYLMFTYSRKFRKQFNITLNTNMYTSIPFKVQLTKNEMRGV